MGKHKHSGATFEISIDGMPRTYRVQREHAIEAAEILKGKHPHSVVVVRDMQTDERVAVATPKPRLIQY